ncbi:MULTISPECIES: DNA polymerase [unclassified Aurantimonas]|uniref:DNA polymerase n=1 Tax=unclassified Aurantimonas TaxID=2638230 RepID=UPI002E171703|nr:MULTISPECIES: DNA polymerase [unclassified Aurantimonas]MEC5293457.1 DNA polymerase [Aurantimonas sp. C2-3-R2]MEC5414401.1 DNA polymerase [Aurantimonas sp. C2-4-R8]
MIDMASRLMLFLRDFTGRGADSFYWFHDGQLEETDAASVVEFAGIVVCHDFWMIRDALFDKTGTLPGTIVDVDELRISISGVPEDRLAREKRDVTTQLGRYGAEQEVCDTYQKMFNKGVPFDGDIATKAATAIATMYLDLCTQALEDGELERFFAIEVPAYRVLQLSMSAGISIDAAGLSEKRAQAEHDYFLLLKDYSAKHDMPLETPSRRAIESKLLLEGFVLDEVSVEYLLEFVPHARNFGGDTMALLALDTARRILGSLTLTSNRTRPVVDVFGSRTSRVQLRSPSLQNIPKRYRSIIGTHEGAQLGYVDFDQFEVGIMAALSSDGELQRLYAAGDMYDLFANTHLGLVGNRKAAKQLFLSYAYGMSRKALVDAADSLGVERQKAKEAFRLFQRYEDWKKSVWAEFQRTGRVATVFGNHYRRSGSGQLTGKEQRSAVSQVVQGTASLIFKRALLAVASIGDVRIVLPMHDALLFEHSLADTPTKVVEAFESVMTDVLDAHVTGKASIGDFVEREQS